MYRISAECEFDSAHFLKGYPGACANLHGHRWRVVCEAAAPELISEGPQEGMVLDFKDLKTVLRGLAAQLDHRLIYQAGSLKPSTEAALAEEGFALFAVPFRPTAENLARWFHEAVLAAGIPAAETTVYETPSNAARYRTGGEGESC